MAGTCTFNVGQVRRLYEHSKASELHSPGYDHLFEGAYYPGGKPLNDNGKPIKKGDWPDSSKIDQKLVPACLFLVGDQGLYLMSNGTPGLLVEEGKSHHVVAYAKESDPTAGGEFGDWYDAKVRIFGGDDGACSLPLSMFDEVLNLPDNAVFKVKITSRNIQIINPGKKKNL